jgi:hypothetical protein
MVRGGAKDTPKEEALRLVTVKVWEEREDKGSKMSKVCGVRMTCWNFKQVLDTLLFSLMLL